MPTRIDGNQKQRFFSQPTFVIFPGRRAADIARAAIYFFAMAIGNFLGAIARSMPQPGRLMM